MRPTRWRSDGKWKGSELRRREIDGLDDESVESELFVVAASETTDAERAAEGNGGKYEGEGDLADEDDLFDGDDLDDDEAFEDDVVGVGVDGATKVEPVEDEAGRCRKQGFGVVGS